MQPGLCHAAQCNVHISPRQEEHPSGFRRLALSPWPSASPVVPCNPEDNEPGAKHQELPRRLCHAVPLHQQTRDFFPASSRHCALALKTPPRKTRLKIRVHPCQYVARLLFLRPFY
jgi:hypothetical protein